MPDDKSTQLALWEQSPFDRIRHGDEKTGYWLARELMPLLGYIDWRNFKRAIKDAQTSCRKSGVDSSVHFGVLTSTIQSGKGRKQEAEDFKLSRHACNLILMNGDPSKPAIADAQAYFSAKTHQAEQADKLAAKQLADKRSADVVAYQLHGRAQDWATARVASKEAHVAFSAALVATHKEHAPDFVKVGAAQNRELFDMTKREIIAYLGLLPKDEPKYRDMLGKYALQAIDLVDTASQRQMVKLGRDLTTDEQIAIVREKSQRAARIMRDAAEMAGVDYLSGAPVDDQGQTKLTRNVRLLK